MSYTQGEFLESVNDVTILFQEVSDDDRLIAEFFGIPYIGLAENIVIGEGLFTYEDSAKYANTPLYEFWDCNFFEQKSFF